MSQSSKPSAATASEAKVNDLETAFALLKEYTDSQPDDEHSKINREQRKLRKQEIEITIIL